MRNDEIISDVSKALADGKSKERVYIDMLTQGATLPQLEECYSKAEKLVKPGEAPIHFVTLLFIVGGASIAAGAVSLIATNWHSMGGPARTASFVALSAFSYGTAIVIERKSRFAHVADLFHAVGAGLLGVSVFVFGDSAGLNYPWQLGLAVTAMIFGATAQLTKRPWIWALSGVLTFITLMGVVSQRMEIVDQHTWGGLLLGLALLAGALVFGAHNLRRFADERTKKLEVQ